MSKPLGFWQRRKLERLLAQLERRNAALEKLQSEGRLSPEADEHLKDGRTLITSLRRALGDDRGQGGGK